MNEISYNLRFIFQWIILSKCVINLIKIFQSCARDKTFALLDHAFTLPITEYKSFLNGRWCAGAAGVSNPNSWLIDTYDEIIKYPDRIESNYKPAPKFFKTYFIAF